MEPNKKRTLRKAVTIIFLLGCIAGSGGFLFVRYLYPVVQAGADRAQGRDPYYSQRKRLVEQSIASPMAGRDAVTDKRVLDAMMAVRRHEFVSGAQKSRAYEDRPLPIGYGQTISQPYIVAYMTQLLELDKDDKVLEIGTGSGYQAAVCAKIAKKVYTIEIVPELAKTARERLDRLDYDNVETKHGDGYYGWEEHAPFDAVIVTAAASHIPPPLVEQLKPGGRMAIPVGPPMQVQFLMLVKKKEDGSTVQETKMPVRFVPFTRKDEGAAEGGAESRE